MMFTRTCRIVLLVIALVSMIWPTLIGSATRWIGLIALVLLLIKELTCSNGSCGSSMKSMDSMKSMSSPKRKATKKKSRRRR